MKSTIGNALSVTLFGESHSAAIGAVIEGLAPGIKLDLPFIAGQMDKRRPKGNISTKRHEDDEIRFVSGFFDGYTTGTPLCLLIENRSQRSGDYEALKALARPSHADYTAYEKYFGFQDYRGGGHFSGRLTAPIVAAGAICLQILKGYGIAVGTHIKSLHGIEDAPFAEGGDELERQIAQLNAAYLAVLEEEAGARMTAEMEKAAAAGDSVGGILETAVTGMPAGIGEPFFHSVESRVSALLYSVPAVKGVAFGDGFSFAALYGSEANDPFYMEGGQVKTRTNRNGGINGGITNGMPIRFQTAVKPTPSIYKQQQTVDVVKREDTVLQIKGRHDPAVIHRARVVVDSVTAIALVDLFCERYGYLWTAGRGGPGKK